LHSALKQLNVAEPGCLISFDDVVGEEDYYMIGSIVRYPCRMFTLLRLEKIAADTLAVAMHSACAQLTTSQRALCRALERQAGMRSKQRYGFA
jgi:hypothetical protein